MPASAANSDVFRAVSDPTRRQILDRLRDAPCGVSDLASGLPISQPAVSQHLKVLLDVGLVRVRRDGRRRIYRSEPAPLLDVYDWVVQYEKFWLERLDALGAHLKGD